MYRWDMDEVKREIARYENIMKQTNKDSKKDELQQTIYSYQELEDYYYSFITGAKNVGEYFSVEGGSNYRDVVYDDLSILRRYGAYCPIVKNFVSTFNWEILGREKRLDKLSTSPNSIVEMTSKFYRKAPEFYRDNYRILAEHFDSRLTFVKLSDRYDCSGFTHPIYGTDRVYIDVGRSNSVQDYTSFFHESSHGITLVANPGIVWDDNKYGFLEVDSLFWEMVGTDYAGELLNKSENVDRLKRAVFIDYLYNAELIRAKLDLYSKFSKSDLKNKRLVRNYLKNELGFDKDAVKNICSTYMHEYLHYIISYLTAIELYLIYQVDRDYALELLQKIIMFKDMSIKQYVDSVKKLGIEPGKNIAQYFDMIAPKGGFSYVKKI